MPIYDFYDDVFSLCTQLTNARIVRSIHICSRYARRHTNEAMKYIDTTNNDKLPQHQRTLKWNWWQIVHDHIPHIYLYPLVSSRIITFFISAFSSTICWWNRRGIKNVCEMMGAEYADTRFLGLCLHASMYPIHASKCDTCGSNAMSLKNKEFGRI